MVETKRKTRFVTGPVTFIARHELWDGNIQDHADQGVSIVVTGDVNGKETSLLRFNCFDVEKSYIYGPANDNVDPNLPQMLVQDSEPVGNARPSAGKLYRMDSTVDGNPIGWTIKTLGKNLPGMIARAGYPDIAAKVDLEDVALILPDLESVARELYAVNRNTVKHNRGTDIFEAGNIRFGLEMRRLPVGDGGLAIHVLADLAGTPGKVYVEETEILAFDCFWDGPHYHYGPRNKNHRIYWDRTLVPDPLTWVLEQFNSKKLGPMIERAGYPGVAADLDQGILDAVLPEMGKRAKEMEASGIPAEPTPNLV